jgi:hypothetical protein
MQARDEPSLRFETITHRPGTLQSGTVLAASAIMCGVTGPCAHLGGMLATGLVDVTADLTALDADGWWAVVLPYDAEPVLARFADVRPAPAPTGRWTGPSRDAWTSSMSEQEYVDGV